MTLVEFLSMYGYLVVVGFQAIVLGISGLFHYIKLKMSPESKKETYANKIVSLNKKIDKLLNEVNAYAEKYGIEK